MSWAPVAAAIILCWLAVALAVGTIVGHGIAFGAGHDAE